MKKPADGHRPVLLFYERSPWHLLFLTILHAREAEHHADHGGNADENDWVQVFGLFDAAREEEQRQRKDDAAPVERAVP